MICFFLDTSSRELIVFSVSLTKTVEGGLVIRKGAEVGPLSYLIRDGSTLSEDLPLIIPTNGYQAQSSAGHVNVIGIRTNYLQKLVGWAGFSGSGSLRSIEPVKEVLLIPETFIKKVITHKNSNVETARAAWQGLKLRARCSRSVYVVQGQSDSTQGYEIGLCSVVSPQGERQEPSREIMSEFLENIPIEHNQEVFGKGLEDWKKILFRDLRDNLGFCRDGLEEARDFLTKCGPEPSAQYLLDWIKEDKGLQNDFLGFLREKKPILGEVWPEAWRDILQDYTHPWPQVDRVRLIDEFEGSPNIKCCIKHQKTTMEYFYVVNSSPEFWKEVEASAYSSWPDGWIDCLKAFFETKEIIPGSELSKIESWLKNE